MPSVILVTGGYDHTIRFWEAPSGICYKTIPFPESQVNALEVSPDKVYVAAAGNPCVRLFDVSSNGQAPIMSYDGHKGSVVSVGFRSDGKWLYTGSDDGTVRIWDLRAPGCQKKFDVGSPVTSVVLHPNQSEIICSDKSGAVKTFDLSERVKTSETMVSEDVTTRTVSISADGSTLAAGTNEGLVKIYEVARDGNGRPALKEKSSFEAHSSHTLKCRISPDSSVLATTSSDDTAKLWNMKDNSLIRTLDGHKRWVWDCVFSADSAYLITVSTDNSARLWDLSSGMVVRQYSGHHKGVVAIALNDSTI